MTVGTRKHRTGRDRIRPSTAFSNVALASVRAVSYPYAIDANSGHPILGYVDGFVIMATSPQGLQLSLNSVAEWYDIFNMVVNCSKPGSLISGLRPIRSHAQKPLVIT